MAGKYITAKELKVSCKFEGQASAEIISLRKGAVLELNEDGFYRVAKPTSDYEKKVFMNEATLNGFKSLKAIVSAEAKNAINSARVGNNVDLERKVIALVTENNSLKEENEELKAEVERLTETLSSFTNSAANQGDGLEGDESEIPDYNSMTVKQLKEIAAEYEVDVTGMNKDSIVDALLALHEEDETEA